LRAKAEARADEFSRKFNDERAMRLENLHMMHREQVRTWAFVGGAGVWRCVLRVVDPPGDGIRT
jgi:hypothetical protein